MNVLDFFKNDKPLQRIIYPGAQVAGNLRIEGEYIEEQEPEPEPTDDAEEDYAQEYIRRDDEELRNRLTELRARTTDHGMTRPETASPLSFLPNDVPSSLPDLDIYTKYNFAQDSKPDLAINSLERRIVELAHAERVLVIQGPTGCGKSTQVPQFMLNMCRQENKYCRIAVTQPRRIAAITVARRVSQERGWPLGTVVGYRVGLEAQNSEDTILTYMTTGVLLQQLVTAKNMNMYTHIILDEVHERDQEMDFLLLIVKKFSRQTECQARVILMSATIDTQQFSNYFALPSLLKSTPENIVLEPVPVLDVVKPSAHIVNIYYLDQLTQLINDSSSLEFDPENAKFNLSFISAVEALLQAFDRTDGANAGTPGSVLIFLPGIYEIEEMYESLLQNNRGRDGIKWLLVPLHSSITVEEQKRAFELPPEGHRKIILSTNIAESSVTVPDVIYVIDFCLTKILITDPTTNYSHLKLTWASRSNCIQRAGRVGRTRAGRVYRFVYQKFYDKTMLERTQPEILRCPLHRLVLLAKMLDMGPPHAVLALAMDRPDLSNIRQTVNALKEAGALLLTTKIVQGDQVEAIWDDRDGDLTYIGHIMAKLPLDINCSRLIIFGHMFGVLRECIIMAGAMSIQSIFGNPFNERMRAYIRKLTWSNGSFSDLIAYLHVYIIWEQMKYGNAFNNASRSNREDKAWMQRNFLQPRIMKEWRILVTDLKQRLDRAGVIETPANGIMTEHEKAMMIKVVICGAFYPNYFIRSNEGGQVDEATAVKTLGGRDPFTTVYFTGKPPDQPGQLYVQSIKALLQDCGNDMHVSFDAGGSGKIYVQFRTGGMENDLVLPCKIATEVYRAVKYRQLKMPTAIRCLSAEEGRRRFGLWRQQQKNMQRSSILPKHAKSMLPTPEVPHIELKISFIKSPSQFYAHNVSNIECQNFEEEILEALNKNKLDLVRDVAVGQIYAAPFERMYYRARATYVYPTGPDGQPDVRVIFIDYGNMARVAMSQLRHVMPATKEYPQLAMECTLSHIQPVLTVDGKSQWSEEAITKFAEMTEEKELFGKIYSVVDGVCSLELYPLRRGNQTSINQILINREFANPAPESFLSEDDHARRLQAQERNSQDILASGAAIEADPWSRGDEQDVPAPPESDCKRSMNLKGPFSPLEMQVYSMVQCSENKTVVVEWNSVNAVLLDTDPQEEHDRLLVAGSVSTNAEGNRLTLRHTTMMPSLRSFPAIMALLFAPRAVYHVNPIQSRVSALLCGMGYDPETGRSRFPQHDLAFNLDFDLTLDDMNAVNEIREYMNLMVEAVKRWRGEPRPVYSVETCQEEIQHRIRSLLKQPRGPLERILQPNTRSWSLAATRTNSHASVSDIWPLHSVLRLTPSEEDIQAEQYEQQIETMKEMANNIIPVTEITCQLCNVKLYEVYEIRIHLVSQQHRDSVARAGFQE